MSSKCCYKYKCKLIEIFTGAKDLTDPADKSPNPVIASAASYQRRSSVPSEPNLVFRSSVNGKRRNPKKVLRRRSSSGAEILTPVVGETMETSSSNGESSSSWSRLKRDCSQCGETDGLVTKRRGSLPIEVLAVGLG